LSVTPLLVKEQREVFMLWVYWRDCVFCYGSRCLMLVLNLCYCYPPSFDAKPIQILVWL